MILQKILLFFFLLILFFSCTTSCTSKKDKMTNESKNIHTSTEFHQYGDSTLPKINIKVNKQFDNKGHLIKYDSTYTYVYVNPQGKNMQLENKKIYNEFKTHFDKNYPAFFNHKTNDVFFNDSLFQYDFYNEDYFIKRFRMNSRIFNQMFKEMDSMKNEFLKKSYPQGAPKKTHTRK